MIQMYQHNKAFLRHLGHPTIYMITFKTTDKIDTLLALNQKPHMPKIAFFFGSDNFYDKKGKVLRLIRGDNYDGGQCRYFVCFAQLYSLTKMDGI